LVSLAFAIGLFWTIFAIPACIVAYVAGVFLPSHFLASMWGDGSSRGALFSSGHAALCGAVVAAAFPVIWAAPLIAESALSAAAASELHHRRVS
jgi:hypothetical protein